jgi:hypothetical protein
VLFIPIRLPSVLLSASLIHFWSGTSWELLRTELPRIPTELKTRTETRNGWTAFSLSYKRWSLTCGRPQRCVLLRVTARRSRDPPYCCAIQCVPRNLATHGAERSEGKGGEERRGSAPLLLRNRLPLGFWASTVTAWGEYYSANANRNYCRSSARFHYNRLSVRILVLVT